MTQSLPPEARAPRRFDRPLWLAILLAALVLIPRGYLISHAQSERVDDEYHLIRGVHFLYGRLVESNLPLNDPPLGEAITALPLWLARCWPNVVPLKSALYDARFSADTILDVVAVWKTILFLPMIGLVFAWTRRLYSTRAAWLTTAMLLVEPTFAAHIPLPTLDVLGVEGIVLGCYVIWRFIESPTWWRAILAAFCIALAMLLKHTAILLPIVGVVLFAWSRWRDGFARNAALERHSFSRDALKLLIAAALVPVFIWMLCGFDISRPRFPETADDVITWESMHPVAAKRLDHRFPAGMYLASFLQANYHSGYGHPSFLFGVKTKAGWWYYFPVLATYKVPIGLAIVLLLGAGSLYFVRWRAAEISLLVPMIAWAALMMASKIDIGFRHFLPAYIFMLMFASRLVLVRREQFRAMQPLAWIGVAVAAIHVMLFHPDYLTYINFPRKDVWLQISDSNVDWGQGLKLVRKWIDAHPERKEIFVREFGWAAERIADDQRRLGPRAHIIDRNGVLPRSGILIISPVSLAGVYERYDTYHTLKFPNPKTGEPYEPIEILGNALRVYDLDAYRGNKPFRWWKPATNPTATSRPATSPATE